MAYRFPGTEESYLKMRIEGVAEAASRERWIFAWLTIAGWDILREQQTQ